MTDLLTYAAIFAFIVFIYFLVRNEIRKSVTQTTQSSSSLQSERDILEERIAKRTQELVAAENKRLAELHRTAQFGELSRGLFHDLMNPLSSVSLYIENMGKAGGNDPREAKEIVEKVVSISKRMNSFMESIRRFVGNANSKLEAATADVAKEVYIVRDILAYKARMQKVKLIIDCEDGIILPIHPVRLHQLIMNLANNAVEACSSPIAPTDAKECVVKIETRMENGSMVLQVNDNGRGMSDDEIRSIGERQFTTREDGTGIGLMTVKSIVENELAGKMSVKSRLGHGTTFTVTIPVRAKNPFSNFS